MTGKWDNQYCSTEKPVSDIDWQKVLGVVNIVNVTIKQKAGPNYITNKIYADFGGSSNCPYDSCIVNVDEDRETVITPVNNTILCRPHFYV